MTAESPTPGKRRLLAILSADAVGYSRLMGRNEAATIDALDASRAAFRSSIAAHGGRVVDTAGDSVLAVFGSIVEALGAALDVQAALRHRNQGAPADGRMSFRIGVTVGDVVERGDGSVYGDGVNVSARLQALAEPGGICVSDVVESQTRNNVSARFESLGEHAVKNIPDPVRAYRVVADGAAPPEVEAAFPEASPPRASAASSQPSIAVLPFTNVGAEPDQDYFSDGVTEDLITALSRNRWLLVVARSSTFVFKGRIVEPKQVARDLGVRYVLEGSVRRAGNRVRITAQLVDTTNVGQLWTERYDRELADVFALQDEISETIAAAIEPELAHVERERARRKPPESLDAWDLYQRGLWHVWRFTAQDNAEARALFERAVALDPGFAAAFAALALGCFQQQAFAFGSRPESLARGFEAATQAVALDERDALGHAALGRIYAARGERASGIAELRTAVALNPSLAWARYGLGVELVVTGSPEQALPELDLAERLSPHDPSLWIFDMGRAWAWMCVDDFERAIEMARRSVRRPNAGFPAWGTLASVLGLAGRFEEAREARDKTLEMKPQFGPLLFAESWPNVAPAFSERFTEGWRRAENAKPR